MSTILLTGFKNCGKSTVGRLLARRLGCAFLDLDSLIEERFERNAGEHLNFREIFKRVGTEAFRVMELEAACEVRDRALESDELRVVALGGGALMQPETREALRKTGTTVYLYVPWKAILARVGRNGFPGFVKGEDPEEVFHALFEEREPVYRECADVMVNLGFTQPQQAAKKVHRALITRGILQEDNKG